jgi:hypothetical protein
MDVLAELNAAGSERRLDDIDMLPGELHIARTQAASCRNDHVVRRCHMHKPTKWQLTFTTRAV